MTPLSSGKGRQLPGTVGWPRGGYRSASEQNLCYRECDICFDEDNNVGMCGLQSGHRERHCCNCCGRTWNDERAIAAIFATLAAGAGETTRSEPYRSPTLPRGSWWVSCQRPTFPRGSWCTTRAANKGRCYHFAPSKAGEAGIVRAPYLGPRGTYLGPVHGMDHTPLLAAVLVPHPKDVRLLVWVNVWSSENDSGKPASVFYCTAVDPMEVARWKCAGWEDRFQDGPP